MRRERVGLLPLVCCLFLYSHPLHCQKWRSLEGQDWIGRRVESLIESGEREGEELELYLTELTLFLEKSSREGIKLSESQLKRLVQYELLTPFEESSILDYIVRFGEPLSQSELMAIPNLRVESVALLSQLLLFNQHYGGSKEYKRGRSQLILRGSSILERRVGYLPIGREEYEKKPESRYLGDPLLLYGGYRYQGKRGFNAHLTLEKDPGERGVDYLSYSLSLLDRGVIESLVLGSYRVKKGEGLILSNSFSFGGALEPSQLIAREHPITPYSSADESRAFKGLATTLSFERIKIDLLTSYRGYDATIKEGGYSSIAVTGLHNTALTLERKGALKSKMGALSASYSTQKSSIGAIVALSHNSLPYVGRDSAELREQRILGNYRGNWGVNGRYIAKRTQISAELALTFSAKAAFIGSIAQRFSNSAELSLQTKYRAAHFLSPLSTLTKISNGQKVALELIGKLPLSYGNALYSSLSLTPKSYRFIARANLRGKREEELHLKLALYNDRMAVRVDLRVPLLESNLSLHSRGDVTRSFLDRKWGFLLQQELIAKLFRERLSLSARLSYFRAEVWGCRIYSYERDLLYQFKNSLLYGEGLRGYLNLKFKLSNRLELWSKYALTHYRDRERVGEGRELIEGPNKSELKLQLRVKF